MEEIYQALIEEGVLVRNGSLRVTRPLSALKIPAKVQAILAARIDRLPAEHKDLLETVAVIGKDFRLRIVSKVVARPQEELEETLAQLQLGEFIYEQPAARDIEYRFKHQLTREAAYNSVLVARRKALDERIARAIEELDANALDDHLVDLAYHYERSGNHAKAVDYLTRAGIQIAQRSASPEAMRHFERALGILKEMPASRSRDSSEMQLHLAIGNNAYWHEGEGSEEAGKALARMVELVVAVDDVPLKAQGLLLLGYHHLARRELRRASEISEDLYKLSREGRNPSLQASADHLMGFLALSTGEFRRAQQHMCAAGDAAWPRRCHALAIKGVALWYLGFPDQALASTKEGLVLGRDAAPYTYVATLNWAGINYVLRRELEVAEDLFRKALNLCADRGFSMTQAGIMIFLRVLSALRGQQQTGLERMQRGIELGSASSPQPPEAYGYVVALGLALDGRPDEAFSTLTPALEWAEQRGVEFELAFMHELKGRLLEGKFHLEEAENSFRTSIEIARRQSAKSPELRATTSLARLLAKQDRRDEARAMLAENYNWFTEGFDTADLKDAKAMLEGLGNSP